MAAPGGQPSPGGCNLTPVLHRILGDDTSSPPLIPSFSAQLREQMGPEMQKELEGVIQGLANRFGSDLEQPKKVEIIGVGPGMEAEADYFFPKEAKAIRLSYPFTLTDPHLLGAVLAHEYGHLLFDLAVEQNIKTHPLSGLQKYYHIFRQCLSLEAEMSKIAERLPLLWQQSVLLEKEGKIKEMTALRTQWEELRKKRADLLEQDTKLAEGIDLAGLINPYHELFSDLVAATYKNDGSIMRKASTLPGPQPQEGEPPEFRDLTLPRSAQKWTSSEVHSQLAPAGAYIWQKILQKGSESPDSGAYLKGVAEVFATELNERLSNPRLRDISPEKANLRLIKKLDTYIKKINP